MIRKRIASLLWRAGDRLVPLQVPEPLSVSAVVGRIHQDWSPKRVKAETDRIFAEIPADMMQRVKDAMRPGGDPAS